MKKILLIIFITASLNAAAQTIPNYVPTNGLVGYWPFNGNANDVSGNGNNGTVNGATLTNDRNGNANSAYSFDGTTNYIEVADNNTLDLTNNYTFSVWVKIGDYSLNDPNEPQRTMLCKPRTSTGGGYSFRAIEGADWNLDGNSLAYSSGWNTPLVNGGIEAPDTLSLNVSPMQGENLFPNDSLRMYQNKTNNQMFHTRSQQGVFVSCGPNNI